MKHLKGFNEGLSNNEEFFELKDFCETTLAYLIDMGFTLRFRCRYDYTTRYSKTSKSLSEISELVICMNDDYDLSNSLRQSVNWNSIDNIIIPFIQLLSRRYRLRDFDGPGYVLPNSIIKLESGSYGSDCYTLENLVKGIDLPKTVHTITIKIEDKL